MPYTRTNAYVAGDPVEADDIRQNHEQLRAYLNRRIIDDDIASDSVDWTQILSGEFLPITGDCRFTTGNLYSEFIDSEPSHLTLISSTMKLGPHGSALYHPLIGRRVYVVSNDSPVLVSVWLCCNTQLNLYSPATGVSDNARIYVDGEFQEGTQIRFFAPDTSATSSDAGGNATSRIRTGSASILVNGLAPGWHDIVLAIDPQHDLGAIFSRSMQVEVFEV